MKLSYSARAFIALVIALGICVVGIAIQDGAQIQILRLSVFVVIACVAARLKIKLPGLSGSMSVNLPFILIAVAEMGFLEALVVACLSNLTQCLPGAKKKFNLVQAAFNVCTMALAVGATRLVYDSAALGARVSAHPLQLAIAALAFFLVNTVPVAIVIRLTEPQNVFRTWRDMAQLSFPYYLASAGLAGLALTLQGGVDWQLAIAISPLMVAVFYSYRRYFSALTQVVAETLRRPMQSQPEMSAQNAKAGA